jgi:hypothetical protein
MNMMMIRRLLIITLWLFVFAQPARVQANPPELPLHYQYLPVVIS